MAAYKASEYPVTPRMAKGDAMKSYLLSNSVVMSLPYEIDRNTYVGSNSLMYLFEEHIYIETGLGNPAKFVKELELVQSGLF
ncbi:hypothetical protein EC957_003240 [Mortierella hygrophila]|uniref:Uncharacterized protein n=1 Tax=Mortierella hygrophila TaxID=979708 RepID=A0A9P6F294_9FUNG|nr:hypothetical protein EC957_003240 [Mortierella hygrophila]